MRKLALIFAALLGLCAPAAAQNYQATAGAGLTFGANLVGGILFPQQNMCDPTTPSRCVVVDASGRITVLQGTSPWVVSNGGTFAVQLTGATNNINNISGTISLPTGAATAANQATANSSLSNIETLAASPVPCLNATTSTTNSYTTGATNPANCDLNGNLYVNAKIAAGQTINNSAADPCQTTANSGATINISSATTTRIITPSASNRTYICSIDLLSFAANNVAIVEGTGGTCGTGTAGIVGGTTTGAGVSFPAQGGLVKGGAGSWVWRTAGTNVDFCLITSTTGPLTGYVKYVQAP